jgi:SAM-dependent methyltransferase
MELLLSTAPISGTNPAFLQHREVFACPACGAKLAWGNDAVQCAACSGRFPIEDGIPRLFHPHDPGDKRDVTDMVKAFYETNPFPNYDDLDSRDSLAIKARRGVFARLLDEQIAPDALVLEVGCGTGQLTNFLGMSWNRTVFGSDLCLNSLRLANGFRNRCAIGNAGFLQMNLFRPAFSAGSFDLVVSNGVLHHTGDPVEAFASIARLVKPGGYIIVGLYNKLGRLTTDFRRYIFKAFGDGWSNLFDGHMRNREYNQARKRAWFMDQYKHPCESKHSYDEVMGWFDCNGFDFLFSIPKIGPAPFEAGEKLFVPHGKGSRAARILTELDMLARGGVDGALFIMIGRKRSA